MSISEDAFSCQAPEGVPNTANLSPPTQMETKKSEIVRVLKTLKHGDRVTVRINGDECPARVNIQASHSERILFAQNIHDGVHEGESWEFLYLWSVHRETPDGAGLDGIAVEGTAPTGTADMKELDRLVIDDESRAEIEAVLKQHKFGNKIFEEWGLGDVIEYGKGMNMLFWGPPGTGKTWGAHCIAKALGKELLIVTPSQIQTSEPGGANRAIEAAFAEAKSNDKVLFFDECDGLICNRENVGMILGSEINTLLTEIEKSEGVCILCTNLIGNLDKALERRISLIQEFPEPDKATRELIWKKMLPPKMPIGEGVTAEALSKKKLTGGQIKNVLLAAARRAVSDNSDCVTLDHFETAIDKIKLSTGMMGKTHNPWANSGPGSGSGTSSKSRAAGSGSDRTPLKTPSNDKTK